MFWPLAGMFSTIGSLNALEKTGWWEGGYEARLSEFESSLPPLTCCATLGRLLNFSMPLFSHLLSWDHDSTYMCCRNLKQTSLTSGRAGEAGRVQILRLAIIDCLLCDWL